MGHWQISERFFVRTTGFPFELIELDAACITAAMAEDRAVRVELDAQASALHALLGRLREAFPSNQRRRARRQVVARSPLTITKDAPDAFAAAAHQFNVALADTVRTDLALAEAYQALRTKARGALFRAASREDFREAVLLLSIGAHRTVNRYLASGTDGPPSVETASTRKAERRIYLYLQRFCTKAETTSFFGPIASGRLDRAEPEAVRFAHGPQRLRDRRTYPAGWLVRTAADAARRRFGDHLPIRASRDLITIDGVVHRYVKVDHFSRKLVPIGPAQALAPALALADGRSSTTQLCAANPEQTDRIGLLVNVGALTARPRVPRQAADGLSDLADQLDSNLGEMAAGFSAELRTISDLIAGLADVAGPARGDAMARIAAAVEAAYGVSAYRKAGQHYADRYPFFEDATRAIDGFVIGGPLIEVLDGLSPILDLWLAAKLPSQRFRESRFHQWLDAAFNGAEEVRLAEVVARLWRARTDPEDVDDAYLAISRLHMPDAFPPALKSLMLERAGETAITTSSADFGTSPVDSTAPYLSSADLLLLPPRGDAGRWRCVLGEAHRMVCAFRFFLDGLPDEEDFEAAIDDVLSHAGDGHQLLKVYDDLDAKLSYRYLSPLLVDFDPADAGPERRPAVSWDDLTFVNGDDGWELRIADTDKPARFLFGPPREIGGGHTVMGVSVNAKGMPPRDVSHLPRVNHEDIVIMRETWAFAAAAIQAIFEGKAAHRAYLDFAMLRAEHGMPRYLFVRSDSEPKPIWLDADNPVALDTLRTMAKHATGRLTFSEMLPGPDELWFKDDAGRYVCELRTNLVRPAGAS